VNAVDTHAHAFTAALKPIAGARYVPAYDARLEDLLALQDASGVTHGVLVQPSFLGTDNSFLLAALDAHSRRLRGTAVADPSLSAHEIAQWDARGVRGIRLNVLHRQDMPDFSAPEWAALFARVADRGWHVEVHASAEQMSTALRTLAACPASLVFDHFGLPDPHLGTACPNVRALLRLAESRPVYVKLSAPYRLGGGDAVQYAQFWLAHLGAPRLLWGSDWPWTNFERSTGYAECVANLLHWVPEAADRRLILWDTPNALFRFL
jgi:predicted TIM-barrel fold metal-dependent hydrolase